METETGNYKTALLFVDRKEMESYTIDSNYYTVKYNNRLNYSKPSPMYKKIQHA